MKSVYEPRYDGPYKVVSISGNGVQLKLKHKTNGKIIVRNRQKGYGSAVSREKIYEPVTQSELTEGRYSSSKTKSSEETTIQPRYPRRAHQRPQKFGFTEERGSVMA